MWISRNMFIMEYDTHAFYRPNEIYSTFFSDSASVYKEQYIDLRNLNAYQT
jgi:hypothetical protein